MNTKNKVYWTDPSITEIVGLELTGRHDQTHWDVTLCTAKINDCGVVELILPFTTLPRGNMKPTLIQYAKDENVFLQKLNMFSAISTKIV